MARMVTLPDGRTVRQDDPELRAKLLASGNVDPNRPLLNQDTLGATDQEYADITAQQRDDAIVRRNMAAAAETITATPEDRKRAFLDEAKKLGSTSLDVGVRAPSLDDYRASIGATSNTMPKIQNPDLRDPSKEQAMMEKLGISQITTDAQFDKMMKATYSQAELQAMGFSESQASALANAQGQIGNGQAGTMAAFDPALLKAQGYSDEQIAALQQKGEAANAAQTRLNQTPEPTNNMMYTLQQALKAKSGVGNQALGTSNLYDQAGLQTTGVGGYGILAQNLNQRRREMGQTYDSYANLVGQVGGEMSDVYNTALDSYKATMETYNQAVGAMNEINQAAKEQEYLLEKIKLQHSLNKEMEQFLADLEPDTIPGLDGDGADISGSDVAESMGTEKVPASGSRATNVLGSGTITGYGSAYWKHGLDFVVDGGMGADVVAPVSGEVIQVDTGHVKGEENSFGNRVKIRTDNGDEIWLSHLQDTGVNVGDKVKAGQTVGTQGNTGSVYGKTGIHVDVTMKKADGGYYSPQDVQRYLQAAGRSKASQTFGKGIEQSSGALGAIAKGFGVDVAGLAQQGYEYFQKPPEQEEEKQSFTDRYFDATNDRNIYNPKSDLVKDLSKMTPEKREQYLEELIRLKKEKEAKPTLLEEFDALLDEKWNENKTTK